MTPIFTIHAGEYLVGSFLEQQKLNVWVPSKDTGVDLFASNRENTKTVSLQVKFSRNFTELLKPELQKKLTGWGFWTLNAEKIKSSKADYWVFVIYSLNRKDIQYLVIKPSDLLKRLGSVHKLSKSMKVYFWVTKKKLAWETRDLRRTEKQRIVDGTYNVKARDFTEYLGNDGWKKVYKHFKR